MFTRVLIASIAIAVLALTGAPAFGVEVLTLYDDFNGSRINPNKWFGFEGFPFGLRPLQDPGLGGDARREVRAGKLQMSYWSYGNRTEDTFETVSNLGLRFVNPAGVTAIKATVTVNSFLLVSCATGLDSDTIGRVRMGGAFFNAGAPVPGDATGDVLAFVRFQRFANSPEPDVFRVQGRTARCEDPACNTQTFLPGVELGTVTVGTPATLSVQWDPVNNQFIYGFNSTTLTQPYSWEDVNPPAIQGKFLGIQNIVQNCTSNPRPRAFVEASFDNVFVNESALSGKK